MTVAAEKDPNEPETEGGKAEAEESTDTGAEENPNNES
jgi:hypothetical protein